MTIKEIKDTLKDFENLGAKYDLKRGELERLESDTGVKSAKYDLMLGGGNNLTRCEKIDRKDKLKEELTEIYEKINRINEALKILDQQERVILMAMFGKYRKPIKEIEYSSNIPYSRSHIYYLRDKALNKMYEFLK